MKIALPTRGTVVDDHFGHCESYTIFRVNENKEIVHEEQHPAPKGCGCKSNIISLLKEKGVTVMLAGNMGQGAVNKLQSAGIEVYRGCSGDIRKTAETFLAEKITDSGKSCMHHQHHHEHGRQCEN
jgi:predicted Fe-Mo cluster-binding NifX family protein